MFRFCLWQEVTDFTTTKRRRRSAIFVTSLIVTLLSKKRSSKAGSLLQVCVHFLEGGLSTKSHRLCKFLICRSQSLCNYMMCKRLCTSFLWKSSYSTVLYQFFLQPDSLTLCFKDTAHFKTPTSWRIHGFTSKLTFETSSKLINIPKPRHQPRWGWPTDYFVISISKLSRIPSLIHLLFPSRSSSILVSMLQDVIRDSQSPRFMLCKVLSIMEEAKERGNYALIFLRATPVIHQVTLI